MIKKFKHWLINRFLPAWAKETLLKEYEKVCQENTELKFKIQEQDSYIRGFEAGVRNQRRIIINTGEVKK